jgi:hypothetical protein
MMTVDGSTTGLKLQLSTTYLEAFAATAWVLAVACVLAGVSELARAAPPHPTAMTPANTAAATRILIFICASR